ncbi:MAG: hypothetical protein NTV54_02255 [Ignavibacteriales bacterium]|nr:hypothetical protein [Ignavibacteriales bacterium]
MIAVLLLGTICYLAIGSYRYWIALPFDLHDRWAEIQYFIRGIDPFDVAVGKADIIHGVGKVSEFGGYTPWAYIFAIPLVPPVPYEVVQFWYFGMMLSSFSITFLLLLQYSKRFGLSRDQSLLICATAVCNWALVYSMRWGQYSLPVLAALTLYMVAVKKTWPVLGGLSLAFAMIKPQVAFLFGFVAIAKKQWELLLIAIMTVSAAWVGAAFWVGKPILSMLAAKAKQNIEIGYYYGLFDVFIRTSHHRESWLLLSGVLFVTIMMLAALLQSRKSVEYHMAVAAVASTMWTYSGVYDSLVLAFMMYYFMLQYYRQHTNYIADMLLIASAILVWQPTGFSHGIIWAIPLIMRAVWIAAIVVNVMREGSEPLLGMS